jgi:hypothetical protein
MSAPANCRTATVKRAYAFKNNITVHSDIFSLHVNTCEFSSTIECVLLFYEHPECYSSNISTKVATNIHMLNL